MSHKKSTWNVYEAVVQKKNLKKIVAKKKPKMLLTVIYHEVSIIFVGWILALFIVKWRFRAVERFYGFNNFYLNYSNISEFIADMTREYSKYSLTHI